MIIVTPIHTLIPGFNDHILNRIHENDPTNQATLLKPYHPNTLPDILTVIILERCPLYHPT